MVLIEDIFCRDCVKILKEVRLFDVGQWQCNFFGNGNVPDTYYINLELEPGSFSDCEWGAWSKWTLCLKSCGAGKKRTRQRDWIRPAKPPGIGKVCEGPGIEIEDADCTMHDECGLKQVFQSFCHLESLVVKIHFITSGLSRVQV